jgi:hypothetical protein
MRTLILAATVSTTLAYSAPALADDAREVEAARVAVGELLASRQQDFCNCFDASLKRGRLVADATFYFEVGATGRAVDVHVNTPGYVPKSLVRCLKTELKKVRFPAAATSLSIEHRLQIARRDSAL